jgi:hypothetical protein
VKLTRRHLLRGAGVALALPWLESLAPRRARGQTTPTTKRFVGMYFPMGTAGYWTPTGVGKGAGWTLSPILEPLAPLKSKVTVLSHVNNTAYGKPFVSPAYPRDSGGFLTCAAAQVSPSKNGISVDQVIPQALVGEGPSLRSLQLGLSTLNSYTEDLPPEFSRSISWGGPWTPLGKMIDPQAVFDALVTAGGSGFQSLDARRATRKSVLDFVADDAASIKPRLSYTDRARLDRFMTSVRDIEGRVAATPALPALCVPTTRPANRIAIGAVPQDYNRDAHATLMIDLMVMALACNLTQVVSFMLDDARSDYVYNFLQQRKFTNAGSTPGTQAVAGGYHGLAQGQGLLNDGYATINRWFVSKLADLGTKLAALPDGPTSSVLDNTVIWFGSGMNNGGAQSLFDLPVLYLGSGGGVLQTDAHIDFSAGRSLSDVYLTFIRNVFGASDAAFADSTGIVREILV